MPDASLKRALLARWYVLLGGLLITGAACNVAVDIVPPQYELTSSVLLLPNTAGSGTTSNPYLSLGGLQATADVVARALGDQATVRRIEREAGTDTYTVERDATTAGPVLLVTVDADDPSAASRALEAVLEALPRSVTALQEDAGVVPAAQFRSSIISRDTRPERVIKPVVRAVLVTAAGGSVLTLLFTAALEGLLIPRRARPVHQGDVPQRRYKQKREVRGVGGLRGFPRQQIHTSEEAQQPSAAAAGRSRVE